MPQSFPSRIFRPYEILAKNGAHPFDVDCTSTHNFGQSFWDKSSIKMRATVSTVDTKGRTLFSFLANLPVSTELEFTRLAPEFQSAAFILLALRYLDKGDRAAGLNAKDREGVNGAAHFMDKNLPPEIITNAFREIDPAAARRALEATNNRGVAVALGKLAANNDQAKEKLKAIVNFFASTRGGEQEFKDMVIGTRMCAEPNSLFGQLMMQLVETYSSTPSTIQCGADVFDREIATRVIGRIFSATRKNLGIRDDLDAPPAQLKRSQEGGSRNGYGSGGRNYGYGHSRRFQRYGFDF